MQRGWRGDLGGRATMMGSQGEEEEERRSDEQLACGGDMAIINLGDAGQPPCGRAGESKKRDGRWEMGRASLPKTSKDTD
jgi:hypothetical protein